MKPIAEKRRRYLPNTDLKYFKSLITWLDRLLRTRIDQRHKSMLPDYICGDGDPESVRQRVTQDMVKAAEATKRLGVSIVNGFMEALYGIWCTLSQQFQPQ